MFVTFLAVVALALACACSKSGSRRDAHAAEPGSAAPAELPPPKFKYPTLDAFVAHAKVHATSNPLDGLQMPPQERTELEKLIGADPSTILVLPGIEILLAPEVEELAKFPGKIIVLPDIKYFDGFCAMQIDKWPGEYLFLGLRQIEPEVALGLALWPTGKSLHLDWLTTVDSEIARRLARFNGKLLGLGKANAPGDAIRELKAFKGFVAISL